MGRSKERQDGFPNQTGVSPCAGPLAVSQPGATRAGRSRPRQTQPNHRQTAATAAQTTTPSASGNSEATTVQRRLPVSLYIV